MPAHRRDPRRPPHLIPVQDGRGAREGRGAAGANGALAAGGQDWTRRSFFRRVADAARGVWESYRREPNLRFHVFAAAAAVALARATGTEGWRAAYLSGSIALVLAAELANTAVERAVDLASGGRPSRLAAQAKDAAAGVVLVASLHALAAAWIVFVQPAGVAGLMRAVWDFALRQPYHAGLLAAVVGAAGAAGVLAGRSRS